MANSISTLALHGGEAVRSKPFPGWPQFDDTEERRLLEVLHSGAWWRYAGDQVKRFEEEFARTHDSRFALAVCTGTLALEACFSTLKLEPGDEVLVPSYTFVATATAVVMNQATPVFVDISPETLNIDLDHAAECITPKTRAIAVVHFGGLPCDMDSVRTFAGKHNLRVVEDAAHAHGARWDGKGVGSHSDIAGFSFQASKNMTGGEGGMILTDDEDLLTRAVSRHSYGQRPGHPWYSHHIVSTNLRMTEWQGAILRSQLERLPEQTSRRLANARKIDATIRDLPGLSVIGSTDPRAAERAYHLYSFRFDPSGPASKEKFVEALTAEGIPCSGGYPVPLYRQPLFESIQPPAGMPSYSELRLPRVEQACSETVWILQNALLGDEDDTADIIRALEKVSVQREGLGEGG